MHADYQIRIDGATYLALRNNNPSDWLPRWRGVTSAPIDESRFPICVQRDPFQNKAFPKKRSDRDPIQSCDFNRRHHSERPREAIRPKPHHAIKAGPPAATLLQEHRQAKAAVPVEMRVEIQKASHFLTNLVRIHCKESIITSPDRLEQFCRNLEDMLCDHYQQHWFPEKPCKGSGYRCIRINHKMDPILSKAGTESGFAEESLPSLFPSELTMWIDPREVSYRIGENGSICVLYDGSVRSNNTQQQKNDNSPWSTPKRGIKINQSSSSDSSMASSSDDEDDSSSSSDSCSPMSMSPPSPTPTFSCKESLRGSGFIMDPRSLSYEFPTFVAS
ncbi:hypothetical protein JTE90_006838 [Oedothorax gibbosus]|uniref:Anti-proliferative protein domain-containing protein n=1 Tax=Oedothorax gibbosus TaxID=931172 RepID=A0AAV6TX54_9ARAC|nr:hypothetical protein JTE90_006838 [Oedothorax gibbosus]